MCPMGLFCTNQLKLCLKAQWERGYLHTHTHITFTVNTLTVSHTCICSDLWWLPFQLLPSSAVGLPDLWKATACSYEYNQRPTERSFTSTDFFKCGVLYGMWKMWLSINMYAGESHTATIHCSNAQFPATSILLPLYLCFEISKIQ